MKAEKNSQLRKNRQTEPEPAAETPLAALLPADVAVRIEFHRKAMALLPGITDSHPGVAMVSDAHTGEIGHRSCSCLSRRQHTCPHLKTLEKIHGRLEAKGGIGALEAHFCASVWYRLADVLAQEAPEELLTDVRLSISTRRTGKVLWIKSVKGKAWVLYPLRGPDGWRLLERFGRIRDEATANRGNVLKELEVLTRTPGEWQMLQSGFMSRSQARTQTFWYRLAYHGYREYGDAECLFSPAIDTLTGEFRVSVKNGKAPDPVMVITVPRPAVKRLLAELRERLPNQHAFAVHPIPLKSVFKINRNTELDLEVRPAIRLIQQNGEARFFEREDLEKFTYGRLVYIPELQILAELDPPGRERTYSAPKRMTLKNYQVPAFLENLEKDEEGQAAVDAESLAALKVFKDYDTLEIFPLVLERDWCWLSVRYGVGSDGVSLAEILKARKENQRYLQIAGGWVDTASSAFDFVDPTGRGVGDGGRMDAGGRLQVSKASLFRIDAMGDRRPRISGAPGEVRALRQFLDLNPASPLPEPVGMGSALRAYQKNGVAWLWFLYENGLGGLLCDDMGLGKTHQVMALMLALKAAGKSERPHLVVCPPTVMGHWQDKLSRFAPDLGVSVYHGTGRDVEAAVRADVVVTSYGVLRGEQEKMAGEAFCLAVFDEAQVLKNADTKANAAAHAVRAEMKIGLTGTPIENRIEELKSLMDLVMPGYLGDDASFRERFARPLSSDPDHRCLETLQRLVSPFTLRRQKRTVLAELPPKIEDTRTCLLSDDQVRLYREAIATRGGELLAALEQPDRPVPYIHIFALLTLLKQICDHPALVEGTTDRFEAHASGKWDLFRELVSECMEAGLKVVVYSQFLGMIDIIHRHLSAEGISHVCLTGATRNRSRIIDTFNREEACRVFVGSLMAGGLGIDLVSASVVIHYDRWWNAAREDQATDRVHRIGQTRGVQVFKLVTEGTLEEKIAAIIDKKRRLMESIVEEEDPELVKVFSRQELMEILRMPAGSDER